MKIWKLMLIVLMLPASGWAQHTLELEVVDHDEHQPLIGASVSLPALSLGDMTDEAGHVTISGIPAGAQIVAVKLVGFADWTDTLTFPLSSAIRVELEHAGHEGHHDDHHDEHDHHGHDDHDEHGHGHGHGHEEVLIAATRTSRSIDDVPTRVEAISGEEIGEKVNMDPSSIAMLLSESTGIIVQQTSGPSATSGFRIQGLDGRYTQLLKDGFPLYAGFSGGLSLMQTLPLDLRQVEVIKGSSSTLYGGGAIAGLVNLVSKVPEDERELEFMFNGTTAGGMDASAFYSEKWGKWGMTFLGAYNHQRPYDAGDGGAAWSDLPGVNRITVNPRLFWYPSERTKINFGVFGSTETREGGYMDALTGEIPAGEDAYTELNQSDRIVSQIELDQEMGDRLHLNIRNSVNLFSRTLELPNYRFGGDQVSTFSEASLSGKGEKADWIVGVNVRTDQFEEGEALADLDRSYQHTTLGAFGQHTWDPLPWFALESGLRVDGQNEYGWFVLPRVSALFRMGDKWTSRLGGGMGYTTPTVFIQDAEALSFRNVLPPNPAEVDAEQSAGVNWDVNYRTTIFDQISFSINQLFFYTRIAQPLLLESSTDFPGLYEFRTADGHFDSQGSETNVRLGYRDFHLYVGYTFLNTRRHYGDIDPGTGHVGGPESQIPLTPAHKIGSMLMYEVHGKVRIGLEAYYTGQQFRTDGTETRPFWIVGLMMEKNWKRFGVYANFENFTDTRQSRFESDFVSGTPSQPNFREIWAPTDGFVANAGIKLHL
ncbi:TonB-dependent receptor domain-containing protein [Pontibacter sp. G13]|uniref:TonB-dependent receptor n=1 Tax=Pontibacter sp. G13 TaxID=3074898 RepID=UPI00288A4776|nr:TonB-dependent receptor [Pontibacter sp. G13]WNJ21570.1 TonB-dependent receptor plug domain-containing protein [Pontibacter sp. G13]